MSGHRGRGMVALGLSSRVQERHPDAGRPGTRVEQEPRDIVQQAEHVNEIVRTEMPGWYFWMPYPGVRYYSHEPRTTALARSGRSLTDAPTGGGERHALVEKLPPLPG